METTDLRPMIEDLRDKVDDLEIALAPLLRSNLSDITSKLPLLDKAKLSVLTTYAIESILFSVLKLNGVNAKEHPVFEELARVKQYFAKLKEAETRGPASVKRKLDPQVANRFIQHGLAGNDKFDQRRTEQKAQEKANARKKFEDMSESVGTTQRMKHLSKKRKAADDTGGSSSSMPPEEHGPDEKMLEGLEDDDTRQAAEMKARKLFKKTKKHKKVLEPMIAEENSQGYHKTNSSAKESKHGGSKKKKSSKPPRDGKSVFKDLLNRPSATE